MTSRELVSRTLRFENAGRIPRSLWILPSAYMAHGQSLVELLKRYPLDINPRPPVVPELSASYRKGTFKDEWGSVWLNLQDGIAGEVKEPALASWSGLGKFMAPPAWTDDDTQFVMERHERAPDAFTHIVAGSFFERMQYLRGTEQLYMDLIDQPQEILRLRDIIMDYLQRRVEKCLKQPCDAIHFADDWGSQRSLLISPALWREFFKPCYARLFAQVHRAGKFVFMHSDGFIMDIIEDLIEVGVNALNCQVWAMGPDRVGARFRGRITFWGELNRQTTVPHGTPDDIRAAIRVMKNNLGTPGGGLIAQSEVDNLTPLSNIEAILQQW
jgi:uroporphyrinogen decarboxylase